ncbi:hypothetical protein MASR2M41_21700 [Flammeovirgaceae bacterium]
MKFKVLKAKWVNCPQNYEITVAENAGCGAGRIRKGIPTSRDQFLYGLVSRYGNCSLTDPFS